MKTTEQIIDLIAWKIGLLYHDNPHLYGGSPEGVENLMHVYHGLWSEIIEKEDGYKSVMYQVYSDEGCSSFAGSYCYNHPDASSKETTHYILSHWRKISDRCGVPIPHEAIIEDLKRDFDASDS
jgi:hypothetical protein